jgi:hypothetical protein
MSISRATKGRIGKGATSLATQGIIGKIQTFSGVVKHKVQKSLAYSLKVGSTLTSSLSYKVLSETRIAKAIDYAIFGHVPTQDTVVVGKSLAYTLNIGSALHLSLAHTIQSSHRILKAARYVIFGGVVEDRHAVVVESCVFPEVEIASSVTPEITLWSTADELTFASIVHPEVTIESCVTKMVEIASPVPQTAAPGTPTDTEVTLESIVHPEVTLASSVFPQFTITSRIMPLKEDE